ncbi:glycosyltransferase family 4 protein [Magnetofaba australis]|uniref:Putative group 1 glycosyl transferase n=1 Tax=Magnetofaba australis IT-1 TaxID=1434232 RepID=A0A1Y2K183_9PROT|nr:glycosyltransferase family 4 protein [Magnetofaba australis]OSM00061.1 putative group 1 glycosyl transferase [Magnetofaba australis IT-1]
MELSSVHLTLLFTRGVSLTQWEEGGMLERELALYRALRPNLGRITLITHGHGEDARFKRLLPEFDIVYNRWRLPTWRYAQFLNGLWRPWRRGKTIFKSNQTNGADIALTLAKSARKPFIARAGYAYADFAKRKQGFHTLPAARAAILEHRVFNGADRCVVTTRDMADDLTTLYGVEPEKIRVIPNYVECERFAPDGDSPAPGTPRALFVGRLDEQKNVRNLLLAFKNLNAELHLIGDGPLRAELEALAQQEGINARFLGRVNHAELPHHILRATLFIMPSHYEGHPKALLEAMSCGRPVIGGNAPGIRGVITSGENGLLCGHEPSQIAEATRSLLESSALRDKLALSARRYVMENVTLKRVTEQELTLLKELARRHFHNPAGHALSDPAATPRKRASG